MAGLVKMVAPEIPAEIQVEGEEVPDPEAANVKKGAGTEWYRRDVPMGTTCLWWFRI